MNHFKKRLQPLSSRIVNLGNSLLIMLYFAFLLPLLGIGVVLECLRIIVYYGGEGLLWLLDGFGHQLNKYLDLWKN